MIRTPWADDADKRFAFDPGNYYADYEAFQDWLSKWVDSHSGQVAAGVSCMDLLEKIDLYYLLTSAISECRHEEVTP